MGVLRNKYIFFNYRICIIGLNRLEYVILIWIRDLVKVWVVM